MTKTIRKPLGVVIGLMALVGVGAAATHYVYEPYNPGFLEYPTIVALHVVLGDKHKGPIQASSGLQVRPNMEEGR